MEVEEWLAVGAGEKQVREEELVEALRSGGEELYRAADRVRAESVGDQVHVRGIIEFSNRCQNNCLYCGIRQENEQVERYTMAVEEILAQARQAESFGYRTVVLQSGEPAPYSPEQMCAIIRKIKNETALAVTLSLGVYPVRVYEKFRAAGCDRYLLRFETANRQLFAELHPEINFDRRVQALADIRQAGIQVGSGFMIGLPDLELVDLARDILFTTDLRLDMIGCGPYLAAPGTPLAEGENGPLLEIEIYYRVMALLRLLNPLAHIPATTAFDALEPGGRDLVLKRGGNVFMPNMTPPRFRRRYQLYPDKPCVDERAARCANCVLERLAALGRPLAEEPGHSLLDSRQDYSGH